MKFAGRISLKVRAFLGLLLLAIAIGFQILLVLYPSISPYIDAESMRWLALVPMFTGLATLFVPLFVENRGRRRLALVGLIIAYPISWFIRLLGSDFAPIDMIGDLGRVVFITRFFTVTDFTLTYALLFIFGWLAFRLVEQRTKRPQ